MLAETLVDAVHVARGSQGCCSSPSTAKILSFKFEALPENIASPRMVASHDPSDTQGMLRDTLPQSIDSSYGGAAPSVFAAIDGIGDSHPSMNPPQSWQSPSTAHATETLPVVVQQQQQQSMLSIEAISAPQQPLEALRQRAAALSTRLREREQQCLALKHALEDCGFAPAPSNGGADGRLLTPLKSSCDNGRERIPLAACENLL
jgi:hypothetical protein